MVRTQRLMQVIRHFLLLFMPAILNGRACLAAEGMQKEAAAQFAAMLVNRGKPVVYNQQLIKDNKHYRRSSGRLLVHNEKYDIAFDFQYYRSRVSREKTPLVFIYSGISGAGVLEKVVARNFAKRGVSSVISHYFNENDVYDLEKTPLNTLKTLQANLALVDHFGSLPEVAADKLALVGISYGGIRGVYHMATDPRIKAAALMVAGAPLPEIMAYSELPQVGDIRGRQMKAAGIDHVSDYLAALRRINTLPLEVILQNRNPDDFYLFISNRDTWVPSVYQWDLLGMLGSPRYRTYSLGHVETPVWVTLRKFSVIHDFFKEKWDPTGGRFGRRRAA